MLKVTVENWLLLPAAVLLIFFLFVPQELIGVLFDRNAYEFILVNICERGMMMRKLNYPLSAIRDYKGVIMPCVAYFF
jgi:hypothetical protein